MRERIHHDFYQRIRNRKQEPILDPASKNLQAGENAAALPVVRHHKAKVAELKRMVYLLVNKKVVSGTGKYSAVPPVMARLLMVMGVLRARVETYTDVLPRPH